MKEKVYKTFFSHNISMKTIKQLEEEWFNLSPKEKCVWNGFSGYCAKQQPKDSILAMTETQYRKYKKQLEKNFKQGRLPGQ